MRSVSTTLAATAKVTRCLLCNYYRGFRISKTTTEPQSGPQDKDGSLKHRCPHTEGSHRYLYNPDSYYLPPSDVFAVRTAGAWRTVKKSALSRDGIPTVDRAPWAARTRADSDCSS